MRVLIVLPGALGDVIRALPLAARLRDGLRELELGWAVEPLSAPLLVGHPCLDRVHVFERRRALRAFAPFLAEIRAVGYETAIDLGRGAKSALIAFGSGARSRLGFARADAREGSWLLANRRLPVQGPERSKLEQFLGFAELLGVPAAPPRFALAPTAAEIDAAQAMLAGLPQPVIAACVGSSCPSRRWLPDRTAAVLRELGRRRGGSAVLLGTATDRPFAARILAEGGDHVRDLCGRTSLRELMAILGACAVAIGPDSGALHLAAALGRPVVSLWGATSALRSAPWGSEERTISGFAPCAPCFLRHCPIDRVCMRTIEVEPVLRLADRVLAA
jgi:heptosyltransferase-1